MSRTNQILYRVLFMVSLVVASNCVKGQDFGSSPKNVLYYELGGIGFSYFSINYERILAKGEIVSLSTGCGLSLLTNQSTRNHVGFNGNQLKIPVQFNLHFGRKEHKFEFGYGMPIGIHKPEFELEGGCYVFRLGYRYQPLNNGLFLRASINPSLLGPAIPWLMGGFGLGYAF